MKISKTSKNSLGNIDFVSRDKKVITNTSETFDVKLKRASSENYQTRIAELIKQIEDQSEKLSKKIDIKELKIYKKLVSEFLDEVVNNSHKFMKENKLDRRGRHRVYAIIKKINEDLEDLTQEILKEEKNTLLILQKIDEIKGLILDIST